MNSGSPLWALSNLQHELSSFTSEKIFNFIYYKKWFSIFKILFYNPLCLFNILNFIIIFFFIGGTLKLYFCFTISGQTGEFNIDILFFFAKYDSLISPPESVMTKSQDNIKFNIDL